MKAEDQNPKQRATNATPAFVRRAWAFIRHSSFVIRHSPLLFSAISGLLCIAPTHAADPAGPKSIPIAKIKHAGPVDFEREILPILNRNCLACHNQTKAKGALILETPQTILKGGDGGAAVVPKKPAESLLLKAAAHLDPEMIMPPADNKVAASALTPEELGLVQLWIEQGAKGEVRPVAPIVWRPLPSGLNAIYAVALTRDGQFAACGRGNQIFIYHLPTGKLAARMSDPQLQKSSNAGAAHRDTINSLAFSPDGGVLASGGYRDVKLWRRAKPATKFKLPAGLDLLATSSDAKWIATVTTNGELKLLDAGGKVVKSVAPPGARISSLKFVPGSRQLAVARGNTIQLMSVPSLGTNGAVQLPDEIAALACLGTNQFAAAGADGAIRLLRAATNGGALAIEKEFLSPTPIKFLEASPAGTNLLLAGSADGSVRGWDIVTGKAIFVVSHDGGLVAVALRPDGKVFATAGGNSAKLWRIGATNPVAELKGDGAAAFLVADRERELTFAKSEVDFRQAALQTAETNRVKAATRQQKAADTNAALAKILGEKREALTNALTAQRAAEQALDELGPEIKKLTEAIQSAEKESTNATALAKAAKADKDKAAKLTAEAEEKSMTLTNARAALEKVPAEDRKKHQETAEKVTAATKTVKDAEKAVEKAAPPQSFAEHELALAAAAVKKSESTLSEAKTALVGTETALTQASNTLNTAKQALANPERAVRAVAFSADGSKLITAGDDGVARVWHGDTGAAIASLPTSAAIKRVALLGETVVCSGANGGAGIDPAADWTLERTLGNSSSISPLADRVNALRFTPDGQQLLTGGGEPTRGGEIKLWRVKDGALVRDFPNVHSDSVLALDISADGKLIASGAADRMARTVELGTGKILKTFEGHTHHVMGIAWKRDGRTLITTGADNVAKVWDATTGERKKNLEGFGKEVTAAAFIGVSDEVVLVSADGQVALLKDKGDKVRAFAGAGEFVNAVAASADGRIVLGGGADGVLRAWDGKGGKLLAEFPPR